MIRRGFLIALAMLLAGPVEAAFDTRAWLRTHDLEVYDEQHARDPVSELVQTRVTQKYFLPLLAQNDRVTEGTVTHWFRINEQFWIPYRPSANLDKRIDDMLRRRVAAMLVGNDFTVTGLTITSGQDSKGNTYVYFVVGLDTRSISFG